MAYVWIGGHSGLETRLVGEVMEATLEIQDPKEADILMNKILPNAPKKRRNTRKAAKARVISRMLTTAKSANQQELMDDYNRVKEELHAMGLKKLK